MEGWVRWKWCEMLHRKHHRPMELRSYRNGMLLGNMMYCTQCGRTWEEGKK